MKSALGLLVGGMLLALAPTLLAAPPEDPARPRDLQRLQEDLDGLGEQLQALSASGEQAQELRARAEEIRADAVDLKVKARKNQPAAESDLGVTYEEVDDLRRAIADLREDLDRFTRPAQGGGYEHGREVLLPEGTRLVVRLEQPLSSRTAQREDRFDASLARPVRVDGVLAVDAGTPLRGIVRFAEHAQRPAKGGQLEFDFYALYVDRERLDLHTRVVSLQEHDSAEAANKSNVGALLGGVLGGILGGRKGALIGILVGGGGALAASRGDELELPAGTVVNVRLERPLVVLR
jgi:hypothetical protein